MAKSKKTNPSETIKSNTCGDACTCASCSCSCQCQCEGGKAGKRG